jgi:TetR/AcrR family transcriptional regulator, mexJK operon transcriptional repressor
MTTSEDAPGAEKSLRAGSAEKRAAILLAAREAFVRDGVDRVSMDAVAARAGVSKRTVYDYFGTKDRLLISVIEEAAASLFASLRGALESTLSDAAGITTAAQLEDALGAFAIEIGTSIVGSADYATLFALFLRRPAALEPELESLGTKPEELVAERLAHFTAVGLLDAPDPRLAADHFNALTTLLAYNDQPDPASADRDRVRRTMLDGVRVFMRAYAAR